MTLTQEQKRLNQIIYYLVEIHGIEQREAERIASELNSFDTLSSPQDIARGYIHKKAILSTCIFWD